MSSQTNILVTGANGGVGLGICLRLIDDFLKTKDATESLNIIYTTRTAAKGSNTKTTLQAHLHKHHSSNQHGRITFQSENIELTNLLSVRALARKLLESGLPKIDTVIFNAGIGGWTGMNWFQVTQDIAMDIRNNTTWPRYKLGIVGALTQPQLPEDDGMIGEPPLGEVFCANVFGHYMLAHYLMPLLQARPTTDPSRIIWVSSVEPGFADHHSSDFQRIKSIGAYENSKRLTDILALTSNQASVGSSVASFNSIDDIKLLWESPGSISKTPARSRPTIHVFHPGIVVTAVVTLYWIVSIAYLVGIYLARLVGSPWATVQPRDAAHGACWLALASREEIEKAEEDTCPETIKYYAREGPTAPLVVNGRVKWGTASSPLGTTSVKPTEVEKWGINGSGRKYASTWWGKGLGRKPGAEEVQPEEVQVFVQQGVNAWQTMEKLRKEWDERLKRYEKSKNV